MIGQKRLLSKIDRIKDNFPRFCIIVGDKGSGKKEICKYISNLLNTSCMYFDSKIDEVRRVIDMAYQQNNLMLYVFPDADSMSVAAKNSLLKVTEEPPKNAYFIITLNNLQNTLETIQSRGMVFKLDPYERNDIRDYIKY